LEAHDHAFHKFPVKLVQPQTLVDQGLNRFFDHMAGQARSVLRKTRAACPIRNHCNEKRLAAEGRYFAR
jgi:hypothetical protein